MSKSIIEKSKKSEQAKSVCCNAKIVTFVGDHDFRDEIGVYPMCEKCKRICEVK